MCRRGSDHRRNPRQAAPGAILHNAGELAARSVDVIAARLANGGHQSGVDENFSVDVPVEIQFAKGPAQTVWVRTSNEPSGFSATLKQVPLKVSVPVGSSVLAVRK